MNNAEIKINNQYTFTPKSLQIINDSLASEDSGRTEDGVMHIYYIKPYLNKLEITLPPIKQSELSNWTPIFNVIRNSTYFNVTYFDYMKNQKVTKQMYCSNASGGFYSGVLYNGLIQDIKFSLIETGAN